MTPPAGRDWPAWGGGGAVDRLSEMEAFVAVVEQGGFTDAARRLGCSKSAVSKHVSGLEGRLGGRLLHRTTRRVSPTEIGLAYYERARQVLMDAGEADALVTAMRSAPSGTLRVSASGDFGALHLAPLMPGFLAAHPEISVELALGERHAELLGEGFDLALRVGEGEAGSLRARRLAETAERLVAAPGYLARRGRPGRIDDLAGHSLLHRAGGGVWTLTAPSGERRQVRGAGPLAVSDGRGLLAAAVAGLGIAHLPCFVFADALERGLVEEAMPDLPVEASGIYAVYAPARATQPKLRAFADHIARAFAGRGPGDWGEAARLCAAGQGKNGRGGPAAARLI